MVIKSGGREDQLSNNKGLDFYRIKALLKVYNNYASLLKPEIKLLILGELQRKKEIFIKGAYKHGNLKQIFELNNLFSNLLAPKDILSNFMDDPAK